ncbi:hypothetical protein ACH4VR_40200 [Streptomyces sp. NPDC020883]|uniref:hypothetical protein n=1 Tax=Streptomyces sp. NPDC020883 TaxID=3365099 RepID=UPI003796201A
MRPVAEVSDCPRVYGVGSNTDTARYRLTLADVLGVPVADVEGHVIGEHGDQAVVCASTTRVDGRPARINAGLGRTRCGPARAVIAALRAGLGLEDRVVELSVNHARRWRRTSSSVTPTSHWHACTFPYVPHGWRRPQ